MQGYINPPDHLAQSSDILTHPLPSIQMSSLSASYPEVAYVFHLPFENLMSPSRLRPSWFRGEAPYFCVDVSDLCPFEFWQHNQGCDEIGEVQHGKLEVWGLTGWYLALFMRALKAWE